MSDEVFVSKFLVKEKAIYIKLHWKQNEHELFKIYVFDGDYCWSGRFSNEFAQKYREITEQGLDQYNKNVKKCLTGEDDSYVFDLTAVQNDPESAIFSWKKKFQGALLVIGSVPIHKEPDSDTMKHSIIEHLLNENNSLKSSVTDLQNNIEHANNELNKCKSEMEQFINIKTSLETTLYGKFVQLLNAKKNRISYLENHIQKFEETATEINTSELD